MARCAAVEELNQHFAGARDAALDGAHGASADGGGFFI
jgi:hypothetical protein